MTLSLRTIQKSGFPHLNAYLNDANYRAQCRIEQDHRQALAYDAMDTAMIAAGKRWPADLTPQEKLDATARIERKV